MIKSITLTNEDGNIYTYKRNVDDDWDFYIDHQHYPVTSRELTDADVMYGIFKATFTDEDSK